MAEYIKRDDAINAIRKMETLIPNQHGLDYGDPMQGLIIPADVISEINNIQSADVRENVLGNWIKYNPLVSDVLCCSICEYMPREAEFYHYCPNCGADMRGESDAANR